MSVIKINCVDQVLQFTNTPVIAAGGIREDYVEFTFCSQWDGFEKVAVFLKNTDMLPPELIGPDGRCEIPYDVLAAAGRFYIGVFGINAEGAVRTTEYLEYRIVEGAIASAGEPEEPDVFDQMLQAMANKQNALTWDDAPTEGSSNAVDSDAVYRAMLGLVPKTRRVNDKPLDEDVTLAGSDLGLLKKLWEGSWSSGSITVPDWRKYNLFTIVMDGAASPVLLIRWNNALRGIGGNITDGGIWTMAASFTINSDESWQYGYVGFMGHTKDSNHGPLTNNAAVLGIWGVL